MDGHAATIDDTLEMLARSASPPRLEAQPHDFDIGMNVGWYAAAGAVDPVIFLNQLKGATGWYAPSAQDIPLALDENGYVTALPDGKPVVSKILQRSADLSGTAPFSGDFRLYGQGTGEMTGSFASHGDLFRRIDTATLPTEEIDGETYWYVDFTYDPANADGTKVNLAISALAEGDHLRDLALVHHSHLDEFRAGEIFAPEFIADLAPYETLRFLEWMSANQYNHDADWNAIDPEQRYLSTDHFSFNTEHGLRSTLPRENFFLSSAPFEYIIELANETDSNAWVNLPVDITDARVEWMADYAAAHLEDGLQIYWEYGNEVYSPATGFEGSRYAELMAEETFGIEGWEGIVEWDAYRGPQLFEIIRDSSDKAADLSRFVATVWGFHRPTDGEDRIFEWSYAYRYFEADAAQAMADAPPAPAEIITDYAHGLYFGGSLQQGTRDAAVAEYILEAYVDDTARAEALARWLLFGVDKASFTDVTPEALAAPVTGVSAVPGQSISVSALIRADIEAGLDPLRDLETVLRLEGDTLFYRGVSADDWVAVLHFDGIPPKSLAEMIADVEIMGYGTQLGGIWRPGLYSGLAQQAELTLSGHKPFVESFGLTWLGYEGGPHLYRAPEGGEGMFKTFRDDGYATLVQAVWFDLIDAYGVDGYVHYMSHGRYAGENHWGAQAYAGQDLAEAPIAAFLRDTIAASTPDPVQEDAPARTPPPEPAPIRHDGIGFTSPDAPLPADGIWTLAPSGDPRDKLILETARGLTFTGEEMLRMLLQGGDDATRLQISVFAAGGGSELLHRTRLAVTGETELAIALDGIDPDRDMIRVAIQVISGPPVALTDLYLSSPEAGFEPDPDAEPEPAPEEAPASPVPDLLTEAEPLPEAEIWQDLPPGPYMVTRAEKLILDSARVLEPGMPLAAGFTLQTGSDMPPEGRLRIAAYAMGHGSELILRTELDVAGAGPLGIDLGVLPEGRDKIRLVLHWLGNGPVQEAVIEDVQLYADPFALRLDPLAA